MTKVPTTIAVYEDTKGHGVCAGQTCGASLTWYQTLSGRRMPFTGDPVPLRSAHDAPSHRLLLFFSSDDAHWTACPDRDSFKTKRAR